MAAMNSRSMIREVMMSYVPMIINKQMNTMKVLIHKVNAKPAVEFLLVKLHTLHELLPKKCTKPKA